MSFQMRVISCKMIKIYQIRTQTGGRPSKPTKPNSQFLFVNRGYELDIRTKALGDLCASVRHVWDMLQPHYESQCKTMSGTCIGIQTRASVRHVWDMRQPYYDSQCKTMSGTWHWHRDECQCKTCLGHASASREIASVRRVWDTHRLRVVLE
ncbi:Deoxyribodipyrimidine photo-lyase [Gossypium arboreum]|uniref:Deoxyribodipyrimidine photo-lyase n=1 Tax=Gossypium arboreum TaxID=29729 RepID=A0A0B0PTK4_GOSAR|nr:Deoxyribodipyrimidine photo-lyase [Gossypium arboreum]